MPKLVGGTVASGIMSPASMSEADLQLLSGNPLHTEDELEVVEETAKEEKQTEQDVVHVCGRCGWDNSFGLDVKVSEEDKVVFRRSVLADNRFTKKVELYNGDVVITFRSLTKEEDEHCVYAALNVQREALLKGHIYLQEQLYKEIASNRAVMSIQSLKRLDQSYTIEENDKIEETLKLATDRLYKKYLKSSPIYNAVYLSANDFYQLVKTMEMRAWDVNFWQAAEAGKK